MTKVRVTVEHLHKAVLATEDDSEHSMGKANIRCRSLFVLGVGTHEVWVPLHADKRNPECAVTGEVLLRVTLAHPPPEIVLPGVGMREDPKCCVVA